MLPASITITIAVLTVFLAFVTAVKYAVENDFIRMRLIMTAFFIFIVTTLTVCYYPFFFATLPYTIPAGLVGILAGYLVGVRSAEERIKAEGLRHYMRHFAHVDIGEEGFHWWTLLNFYTVIGALVLINFVGLTTVILHNLKPMALGTSALGAFLIGSTLPYLIHLWRIKATQTKSKTTSE
jgi:hypothetical protein